MNGNDDLHRPRLEKILERYPLRASGTSIKVGSWHYRLAPSDGSPQLPLEVERTVVSAIGSTHVLLRELKASRYAIRMLLQALASDAETTTISAEMGNGETQSMSISELLSRLDAAIHSVDN